MPRLLDIRYQRFGGRRRRLTGVELEALVNVDEVARLLLRGWVDCEIKRHLAATCGVSPRSVGRWLTRARASLRARFPSNWERFYETSERDMQ